MNAVNGMRERANALNGADLDQALARAGDGVFAVGADGNILFWNPAAEKIMGYTAREAIGRACCDILMAVTTTATASATRGVTS